MHLVSRPVVVSFIEKAVFTVPFQLTHLKPCNYTNSLISPETLTLMVPRSVGHLAMAWFTPVEKDAASTGFMKGHAYAACFFENISLSIALQYFSFPDK